MTKNLSPGVRKDDKYFLISPFIDFRCQLELTHIEFQKLSVSHTTIKNNITFEENLLQVFYSMAEFESFILESSLRHSLFPISDFEFAQDNRIRGNIKVASFLNSVTSFKDQFPKFDHLSPGVDLKDVFTTLWTDCRNKSVDFSFFERLRNFAQHQTQPVSSYTIGSNWNEELSLHEHRASLFASVEEVSRNRSIKNEERERYFKKFGNKADIGLIFRETLGGIVDISEKIRSLVERDTISAIENFEETMKEMKDTSKRFRVADVYIQSGKEMRKQFSIFEDYIKRAKSLRGRYLVKNYQNEIVSNRVFGHSRK